MINFRIIARAFSLLLIFEGLFMVISAVVSQIYHEHAASSFIYAALITIVTGLITFTPFRHKERIYGNKEGYIIVIGTWVLFSLFGTLPYLLSGSINSFSDAFFESMSGFSTTGATILTDIESMPHGILFWRSLTQWLGGMGVIFISLSVFPVLKSINIQLAATEFSGHPADKIYPRTKDVVKRLITIYLIITLVEVILLSIGGMSVFNSFCHSFSTVSTGGFSTMNNGIAAFNSPYIKIVLTFFMFLAGTNMTLIYFVLKGNFKKIRYNNEFLFYLIICFFFALLASVILFSKSVFSFGNAILEGTFQVISIITTTGFYTHNFNLWGNLMIIILFILMFTGGSSGSTSGGIKTVRLLIIAKNSRQELNRIIHPDAFIPVRLDKRIVPKNTIYNLLIFIIIYFFTICAGALLITFLGYDLVTSFSTSASMLGNIGPGIGTFGPFTNYSALPVAGKWFLSGLMLIGRLELLTVMLLFSRNFYRN